MKESFREQNRNETKAETDAENLPEHFDALIVLGKNWREYPPKNPPEGWQLKLSVEGKMSSLAAAEMYKAGLVDTIIFSSGKTAGGGWPSEAEAMRDYMKSKYPEIPDKAIILEETSIDTASNAEEVQKILERQNYKTAALLTTKSHLPRSEKLFREYGIAARPFPTEEILKKRSRRYAKFVDSFERSGRVKMEYGKEFILRGLLALDPKGKLPRVLSKYLRHAE